MLQWGEGEEEGVSAAEVGAAIGSLQDLSTNGKLILIYTQTGLPKKPVSGELEATSSFLRQLRGILLSVKDNLDLQKDDNIRGRSVKKLMLNTQLGGQNLERSNRQDNKQGVADESMKYV